MNAKLKSMLSRRWLLKAGNSWLVLLGFVGLFSKIIDLATTTKLHLSWPTLIAIVSLLLLVSIIKNFPKSSVSKVFHYPDTSITVKYGDLLLQKDDIVIGFADTFDTEIGSVINGNSVQGQFQKAVYGGNQKKLDEDLNRLLVLKPGQIDNTKVAGKNVRYPIGTTIILDIGTKKYYCCAYTRMGNDCIAQADINDMWLSLGKLWQEIRTKGEMNKVSISVIGSGLARVQGVTHTHITKLIVLSFLSHSRIARTSQSLTIVVSDHDKGKVNLLEIEDFLKSLT